MKVLKKQKRGWTRRCEARINELHGSFLAFWTDILGIGQGKTCYISFVLWKKFGAGYWWRVCLDGCVVCCVATDCLLSLTPARVQTPAEACERERCHWLLAVSHPCQGSNPGRGMWERTLPLTACCLSPLPGFKPRPRHVRENVAIDCLLSLTPARVQTPAEACEKERCHWLLAVSHPCQGSNPGRGRWERTLPLTACCLSPLPGFKPRPRHVRENVAIDCLLSLTPARVQTPAEAGEKERCHWLLAVSHPCQGSNPGRGMWERTLPLTACCLSPLPGFKPRPRHVRENVAIDCLLSLTPARVQTTAEACEKERCHWLLAVSHPCQGSNHGRGMWERTLPLTACCLSPLPGFKPWPRHVRENVAIDCLLSLTPARVQTPAEACEKTVAIDCLLSLTPARVQTPAEACEKERCHWLLAVSHPCQGSNPGRGMWERTLPLTACCLSPMPGFKPRPRHVRKHVAIDCLLSLTPARVQTPAEACEKTRCHWLLAVSHPCQGSNPGRGMWERTLPLTACCLSPLPGFKPRPRHVRKNVAIDCLLSLTPARVQTPAEACERERCHWLLAVSHPCQGSNPGRGMWESTLPLTACCLSPLPGFKPRPRHVRENVAIDCLLSLTPARVQTPAEACEKARCHWLLAVSHPCQGSNPGRGMWERMLPLTACCLSPLPGFKPRQRHVRENVAIDCLLSLTPARVQTPAEAGEKERCHWLLAVSHPCQGSNPGRGMWERTLPLTACCLSPLPGFKPRPRHVRENVAIDCLLSLTPARVQTPAEACEKERCHWLLAVSHPCQGSNPGRGRWERTLPLTACCLSPLPGFKPRPRQVRKNVAIDCLLSLTPARVQTPAEASEKERCHWLLAVSHPCQGSNPGRGRWERTLPLTACCLSPLPGFKPRPRQVRKNVAIDCLLSLTPARVQTPAEASEKERCHWLLAVSHPCQGSNPGRGKWERTLPLTACCLSPLPGFKPRPRHVRKNVAIDCLLSLTPARVQTPAEACEKERCHWLLAVSHPCQGSNPGRGRWERTLPLTACCLSPLPGFKPRPRQVRKNVAIDCLLSLTPARVQTPAEAGEKERCHWLLAVSHPCQGSNPGRGMWERTLPLTACCLSPLPGFKPRPRQVRKNVAIDCLLSLTPARVQTPAEACEKERCHWLLAVSHPCQGSNPGRGMWERTLPLTACCLSPLPGFKPRPRHVRKNVAIDCLLSLTPARVQNRPRHVRENVAIDCLLSLTPARVQTPAEACEKERCHWLLAVSHPCQGSNPGRGMWERTLPLTACCLSPLPGFKPRPRHVRKNVAIDCLLSLTPARVQTPAEACEKERCHWLLAVSHPCQGSNPGRGMWERTLPLTACCLSPLPGFKPRPRHVRKHVAIDCLLSLTPARVQTPAEACERERCHWLLAVSHPCQGSNPGRGMWERTLPLTACCLSPLPGFKPRPRHVRENVAIDCLLSLTPARVQTPAEAGEKERCHWLLAVSHPCQGSNPGRGRWERTLPLTACCLSPLPGFKPRPRHVRKNVAIDCLLSLTPARVQTPAEACEKERCHWLLAVSHPCQGSNPGRGMWERTLPLTACCLSPLPGFKPRPRHVRKNVAIDCLLSLPPARVQTPAEACEKERCHLLLAVSHPCQGSNPGRGMWERTLPLTACCLSPLPGFKPRPRHVRKNVAIDCLLSLTPARVQTPAEACERERCHWLLAVSHPCQGSNPGRGMWERTLPLTACCLSPLPGFKPRPRQVRKNVAIDCLLSLTPARVQTPAEAGEKERCHWLLAVSHPCQGSNPSRGMWERTLPLTACCLSPLPGFKPRPRHVRKNVAIDCLLSLTPARVQTPAEACEKERCHLLLAVSHPCQGSNPGRGMWEITLPFTACCLSPLPGFKPRPRHVRKNVAIDCLLSLTPARVQTPAEACERERCHWLLAVSHPCQGSNPGRGRWERTLPLTACCLSPLPGFKPRPRHVRENVAIDCLLSLTPARVQTPAEACERERCHWLLAVSHPCQGSNPGRGMWERTLPLTACCLSPLPGFKPRLRHVRKNVAIYCLLSLTPARVQTPAEACEKEHCHWLLAVSHPCQGSNPGRGMWERTLPLTACCLSPLPGFKPRPRHVRKNVAIDCLLSLTPARVQTPAEACEKECCHWLLAVSHPCQGSNPGRGMWERTLPLTACCLSPLPGFKPRPRQVRKNVAIDCLLSLTPARVQTPAEACEKERCHWLLAVSHPCQGSNPGRGMWERTLPLTACCLSPLPGFKPRPRHVRKNVAIDCLLSLTPARVQTPAEACEKERCHWLLAVSHPCQGSNPGRGMWERTLPLTACCLSPLPGFKPRPRHVRKNVAIDCLLSLTPARVQTPAEACEKERCHWLLAVSHPCQGSNPGRGMWERMLPLTACCLSPLPGFKPRPRHVRENVAIDCLLSLTPARVQTPAEACEKARCHLLLAVSHPCQGSNPGRGKWERTLPLTWG